jgi:hypothetical protein
MLFSEYIFFPRRFDFMIWQEMICVIIIDLFSLKLYTCEQE